MKRSVGTVVASLGLVAAFPASAHAESGHFVQPQDCRDVGTAVECTGKVAGLGGKTFEITISARGTATVECTNPAGHVAPGQTFTATAVGSSGPMPTPRNGQYRYTVTTDPVPPPADSCPNPDWQANVVDVEFTEATLTLVEDGSESDMVTVPVD